MNAAPVISAFLSSCKANGIATVENSMDADVAVIWSVTWAGRMINNREVYAHYRANNRPVIILEVGSLHRNVTWKISVNNITADGFCGHTTDLDPMRPTKLGLALATPPPPKPSVLVVLQNQKSLQVSKMSSMLDWITNTVNLIKLYTDRKIVVRLHPRNKIDQTCLPRNLLIETPHKLVNTYDSFDINYSHHTVINYNSGAGIQAAIAGANVIVDMSSLVYPVSNCIELIDNPQKFDRSQWLIEIAHTEYLIDEIETGKWIQRLAPALPI